MNFLYHHATSQHGSNGSLLMLQGSRNMQENSKFLDLLMPCCAKRRINKRALKFKFAR